MDFDKVKEFAGEATSVCIEMITDMLVNPERIAAISVSVDNGENLAKEISKHISSKEEAGAAIVALRTVGLNLADVALKAAELNDPELSVGLLTESTSLAVAVVALADTFKI